MFIGKGFQELMKSVSCSYPTSQRAPTSCSLSCQNSFSFALSRNGNSLTWCTKMYRRIGRSESKGLTSPRSDLKGAPNLCNAVGEFSSVISNLTCWEISSRLRSAARQFLLRRFLKTLFTVFLLPSKNGTICLL